MHELPVVSDVSARPPSAGTGVLVSAEADILSRPSTSETGKMPIVLAAQLLQFYPFLTTVYAPGSLCPCTLESLLYIAVVLWCKTDHALSLVIMINNVPSTVVVEKVAFPFPSFSICFYFCVCARVISKHICPPSSKGIPYCKSQRQLCLHQSQPFHH
jgi:hypothetical protein